MQRLCRSSRQALSVSWNSSNTTHSGEPHEHRRRPWSLSERRPGSTVRSQEHRFIKHIGIIHFRTRESSRLVPSSPTSVGKRQQLLHPHVTGRRTGGSQGAQQSGRWGVGEVLADGSRSGNTFSFRTGGFRGAASAWVSVVVYCTATRSLDLREVSSTVHFSGHSPAPTYCPGTHHPILISTHGSSRSPCAFRSVPIPKFAWSVARPG